MKNTNDFLIAHIDVEKTQFSLGENLGIEFKNEIDAPRLILGFNCLV